MNASRDHSPAFPEFGLRAVEVFKTNIRSSVQATAVVYALQVACPDLRASFDLDDCDRVLVLRSRQPGPVCWNQAVSVVLGKGVQLEVLPD